MSFGFLFLTHGDVKYSYSKNPSSVKSKYPDLQVVEVFEVPEKFDLKYKKLFGETKVYNYRKSNGLVKKVRVSQPKSGSLNKKVLGESTSFKIQIQEPIEESYYSEAECEDEDEDI